MTELVANVVRHGRTPLSVDVAWEPPALRVEVRDGSLELPAIAKVAGGGGYGLQIVAALASDWGVEPRHGEKVVWFVVTQRE